MCGNHRVFIGNCGLLRIDKDCDLVEVAGIEPASEGLQRAKTTCVSDPLNFASATYEPARARTRYPLGFSWNSGKWIPTYPAVWRPGPFSREKTAERGRL